MTTTTDAAPQKAPARHPKRRIRKLETRLTTAKAVEAKRTRQAEKARARDGAEKLVAKRAQQLEKATRRSAALEAMISELRASVPIAPAKAKAAGRSSDGRTVAKRAKPVVLRAFCLRERKQVDMKDPKPMVMRNGRAATVGTCPSCGARLIRPG